MIDKKMIKIPPEIKLKTEFFDVAGEASSPIKKQMMADAKSVVRQALQDAINGKEISVYGLPMKLSMIASKLLPHKLIIQIMDKI